MKRRLDLALALVHSPRILFLDEPTTGLDIQSRTALWDEVRRLAKDEGVTVFLTTQYLEEADVLADRVGIIDHGRIVAEGTPDALKAEIGRPTVEVKPADPGRRRARQRDPRELRRAVRLDASASPSASTTGQADLAGIVRALDAEGIAIEQLQLHQPSLDDVFLAKTGRSLEGSGDATSDEEQQRRRARDGIRLARVMRPRVDQVYLLGRRSVVRTLRQPANVVAPLLFPLLLLAVNAGGLKAETNLPGFPTRSIVAFLLAVPFIQGALFATMNTGTDLARDIQTGFMSRLALTPMRDVGAAARPARRHARARALPGVRLHRGRPDRRRPLRVGRRPACSSCSSSTR